MDLTDLFSEAAVAEDEGRTMDTAKIAEILSENKARLSELREHQGRGEDVFFRYWVVGQDALDDCVLYLKSMTTVVNPMLGTRWARAGTWYAGEVNYRPASDNQLLTRVTSTVPGMLWALFQQLNKGTKVITIDEDCAAYTKKRIITTYNSTIPSGTASKGTVVSVDADPTELGRERTVQETTTVKDQVSVSWDVSPSAESTRTLHTENPAVLEKPTETKGVIVRQTSQPTTAGNERTVEEIITVKDQAAVAGDDSAASSALKTLHTEAEEETGAQTAAAGTIVRTSSQPTEAGNFRNVVEVITPKDQTAQAGDDSAAASALKTVHTEAAEETGAQTAAAGTIVRTSSQPTEAGNFRNVVEVITPKDQIATAWDDNATQESEKVIHTENGSDLTKPTAETGTYIIQSAQPTESGKQRTVVEVFTGKSLELSGSYPTRHGTVYWWTGQNCTESQYAAAVATAALDETTNNTVRKDNTQFIGLLNYTIIKQPYDAGSSSWEDWGNKTYSHDYENNDGETVYVFHRVTNSLGSAGIENSAVWFIQSARATSGRTVIGQDSGNKTGITHLGKGRFHAVRVEK